MLGHTVLHELPGYLMVPIFANLHSQYFLTTKLTPPKIIVFLLLTVSPCTLPLIHSILPIITTVPQIVADKANSMHAGSEASASCLYQRLLLPTSISNAYILHNWPPVQIMM